MFWWCLHTPCHCVRSEDSFAGVNGLFFYHMSPGSWTQVVRLGDWCLCRRSHLPAAQSLVTWKKNKKQSGHKRILVRYCHAPGITTAGEREAYHTFRNSMSCMTKVQLLNTIRNKGDSSFSWVHLLINRAVTVYEIVGMTLISLLGYKTVVCRLLELRSCARCCYNHSVLNADVLTS